MGDLLPWRLAWQVALYGSDGFYRRASGPAGHFTTSTHGPHAAVLAEALGRLADREGARHVVDVGAGRGELLTALHAARPDLHLTGVDVVARPERLPGGVAWLVSPGGSDLPAELRDLTDVLVVANEWLDVVPCTVATVRGGRLVEVAVDVATGRESPGGPLGPDDEAWAAAHWPADGLPDGARVEVGLTRDRVHADLLSRVRHGTVLVVDYAHDRTTRPLQGTLTAYRDGGIVDPVPDGSCDLTAHVALDTLDTDLVDTQREALRALGVTGNVPDHSLARTDPLGYLGALSRSSAEASLLDPRGLGGFGWALTRLPRSGATGAAD